MITVEEAETLICNHVTLRPKEKSNLETLQEEVLREPIVADRPFPPYHRVCMDGIALSFQSWERGCHIFIIEGFQKAGAPRQSLTNANGCIEVTTGAVLPQGCDCVVRFEDFIIKDKKAYLPQTLKLRLRQHIHQQGSDCIEGRTILAEGKKLFSPQLAVVASVGKATVHISKRPKIALISTGDELVDVQEKPKSFQIRKSNPYGLLSALMSLGFYDVTKCHLQDHRQQMLDKFSVILETHDVAILSGGVSKGRLDLVPEIMAELSVETIFHRVRQRPGKPLWFGKTQKGQLIFGLPGNPVSALICLHRYVLPALSHSLGIPKPSSFPFAILTKEVEFSLPLTYFLPVKISYSERGEIWADPRSVNGSGDFVTLTESDGFIELEESRSLFPAKKAYPLWFWNR